MDILYKILSKKENPETNAVSGFLKFVKDRELSLGELRCTPCSFQVVLLQSEKRRALEPQTQHKFLSSRVFPRIVPVYILLL